jgi:hypothetical protein
MWDLRSSWWLLWRNLRCGIWRPVVSSGASCRTLNMETLRFSETLTTYQWTRYSIPDDMNLMNTAVRTSNLSSILVFLLATLLVTKMVQHRCRMSVWSIGGMILKGENRRSRNLPSSLQQSTARLSAPKVSVAGWNRAQDPLVRDAADHRFRVTHWFQRHDKALPFSTSWRWRLCIVRPPYILTHKSTLWKVHFILWTRCKRKHCAMEDGTSFLVQKAAISCLPGKVDWA